MKKDYSNIDFGGFPRVKVEDTIRRMNDADYIIDKSDSAKYSSAFNNKFNDELKKALTAKQFTKIYETELPDKTALLIYKNNYRK